MSSKDVLKETITLIKKDEKNRTYFFVKAKEPKWFEPLLDNGLFGQDTIPMPQKTEGGIRLSYWAQQTYLEHISFLIHEEKVTDPNLINKFVGALRNIKTVNNDFMLARALFLMVMRMPTSFLTAEDINLSFKRLHESELKSTMLEFAGHEGLSFIVKRVSDTPKDREIFKTFFANLLIASKDKNPSSAKEKLLFFSHHGLLEFKRKYFNLKEIVTSKPFILLDALETVNEKLEKILADSDLDETTHYWRPAVEEHRQNDYHDSAQAVLVGLISSISSILIEKQIPVPYLNAWGDSKFKTFNRIYYFSASNLSDIASIEEAAKRIVKNGFSSECRHEIFYFLERHFERLSQATQDQIVDLIDQVKSVYAEDEEQNKKHTAWQKLRWLEAIKTSKNAKAINIRNQALLVTDNKVPEHPDFSSYMGTTWVGPTSPKTVDELLKMSNEEIFNLLFTFKNTDEFKAPSIEGLSRALEEVVIQDPVKTEALLPKLHEMDPNYASSLIDGYSKNWSNKKYVPVKSVISSIECLVNSADFVKKVSDEKSRCRWVISSIARFVVAGTRNDENAFPSDLDLDLYSLLKKCLEICPAEERDSSSDGFTRAINEPRGVVFEALIILTLRRARQVQSQTDEVNKVWDDLRKLIEPILRGQNPHEVSLAAMIGGHYRQFQFLGKDWVERNIDIVAPDFHKMPTLWQGFMDGFGYVTTYSKEMYMLLRDKGYLLEYLRHQSDSEEKSSRSSRLQDRIIELALVAYVLGDEKIDEGITGSIIAKRVPAEWSKVIWSIKSIVGKKPKPEHLQKAKELIYKLLKIREDNPTIEMKEHFSGLGGCLDLLEDPADPLVEKIFITVSRDKESPWELGDLVDYLDEFKDSHPKVVGHLFNTLLKTSETIPSWPTEKIHAICQSLVKHKELSSMIDICRIYSERSISCEPIREICASLK